MRYDPTRLRTPADGMRSCPWCQEAERMGVPAWEGQDLGQVGVGEMKGQSADRFGGGVTGLGFEL